VQLKNLNWIGFASGILLMAVTILSFFNPWWQLRIGDFVSANFSPLGTNFNFLGITFVIPLLTAINISCSLLMSISAVLMIAYSVRPRDEYSKQLLWWSYKKPLTIMISFVVAIVDLH